MSAEPKAAALFLIPNLLAENLAVEAALPASALALLRKLEHFVVESEKTAWRLLSKARAPGTCEGISVEILDEHSSEEELPRLLKPLEEGFDLGLVSEAGMPCVADPGAALVALAHDRAIRVVPVSGPSSILLALAASGLDGQRFTFLGYLSQDQAARRRALAAIDRDVGVDGYTRIFIETPYRNAHLLEDCLSVLSPDRRLCVAASLTSSEERIRSAAVSVWRNEAWILGKENAIFLVGKRASVAPSARPSARPAPPKPARKPYLDRSGRLRHSIEPCKKPRRRP